MMIHEFPIELSHGDVELYKCLIVLNLFQVTFDSRWWWLALGSFFGVGIQWNLVHVLRIFIMLKTLVLLKGNG